MLLSWVSPVSRQQMYPASVFIRGWVCLLILNYLCVREDVRVARLHRRRALEEVKITLQTAGNHCTALVCSWGAVGGSLVLVAGMRRATSGEEAGWLRATSREDTVSLGHRSMNLTKGTGKMTSEACKIIIAGCICDGSVGMLLNLYTNRRYLTWRRGKAWTCWKLGR